MDKKCDNPEHEHAPIYCMWHGQTYDEHEVGGMCLEDDCHEQWFFEADWSSTECRKLREWERRHLQFARISRLLAGWKWRAALTYQP